MNTKPQPFQLTPRLALQHASSTVVALSERAFGKVFALDSEAPPAPSAAPDLPFSKVAIMRIRGPLMQRASDDFCGYADGYDAISSRFSSAMQDPSIGVVIMVIDSPGGDCAGLFEAVTRMQAARDAAKKPVFAYADELTASAAYAIACIATDGIYAPRSGDVGSVGAIAIHVDVTGADQKDGFAYQIFRSGPRKAEGLPIEPLNDVAAAALQQRVNDSAQQFFEVVSQARGIPVDQLAALGGACFSAKDALAVKLIDGIASLETVIMMAGASMPSAPGAPMTDSELQKQKDMEAENATLKERVRKMEEDAAKAEEDAKKAKKADDEGGEDPEDAPEEGDDPPDSSKSKAAAPKAKTSALATENAALKSKIAAMDAIDKASEEKRLTPAMRKTALKLADKAPEDVEGFLAQCQDHQLGKEHKAAKEGGAIVALTAEELSVAKQMGISHETFAAYKAARAAEKGSAP